MTKSRVALPVNQDWLLQRIKKLGYLVQSGVCFGMAHMGMQAVLTNDLEAFDKRLDEIAATPVNQLEARLKNARRAYRKNKQHSFNFLETIPFLDGITLYQNCDLYPDYFESGSAPSSQNAQLTAPLVMSNNLNEKGGPQKICDFTGVYTQNDLVEYFSSLRDAALTASPSLIEPVAFIFQSNYHAISVSYDVVNNNWIFIDANTPPSLRVSDVNEIAEKVTSAFSNKGVSVFISQCYGTAENINTLSQVISCWRESDRWKKLHAATPEKAVLVDDNNISWFYLSSQSGYVAESRKLLAVKETDVNIIPDKEISIPLYRAVSNNNVEIVRDLLKREDTDVNHVSGETGATCLFLAAQEGYLECVEELTKIKRTNPNQARTLDGVTPLYMAVQNGHLDVVKALLKLPGIEANKSCSDDFKTPLDAAKLYGFDEIAHALRDHLRLQRKSRNKQYFGGNALFGEKDQQDVNEMPFKKVSHKKHC